MKAVFNKGEKAWSIETDSLPVASKNYLMQYGFDQSMQDCIAGLAKAVTIARQKAGDSAAAVVIAVEKAINEKLQKRMDSIVAGTMNVPQPRDPIRTLAAEYVNKALVKKATKVTRERFAELVTAHVEKHRAWLVKELARREAGSGPEVELDTESKPTDAKGGDKK